MSKLTLSYKLKGNTFSKFKIIFPSLPQTLNFLLTLNHSYRVSAYKKKRKKKSVSKDCQLPSWVICLGVVL